MDEGRRCRTSSRARVVYIRLLRIRESAAVAAVVRPTLYIVQSDNMRQEKEQRE